VACVVIFVPFKGCDIEKSGVKMLYYCSVTCYVAWNVLLSIGCISDIAAVHLQFCTVFILNVIFMLNDNQCKFLRTQRRGTDATASIVVVSRVTAATFSNCNVKLF